MVDALQIRLSPLPVIWKQVKDRLGNHVATTEPARPSLRLPSNSVTGSWHPICHQPKHAAKGQPWLVRSLGPSTAVGPQLIPHLSLLLCINKARVTQLSAWMVKE